MLDYNRFFQKLELAIKQRDYYSLGDCFFTIALAVTLFNVLLGNKDTSLVQLIPLQAINLEIYTSEFITVLGLILNVAVFGIIPVVFYIKHSLKLTPDQRREQKLSLFMPRHIFFIYGFCALVFVLLIVLPRL